MGFWDWLFGKRGPVTVTDAVWLTGPARVRAVCGRLQQPGGVLVLAHFPASLNAWRQELTTAGIAHILIPPRLEARDAVRRLDPPPAQGVLLGLVSQLVPDPFTPPVTEDEPALALLVVERHFLPDEDQKVVAFAASLGRRCEVTFHTALDDPLMRIFAGEWVGETLRKLGMDEDDRIESRMVSRRIRGAQAEIARQVGGAAMPAESADEWLRLNLPGRG
jgi:hypothetical protein